MVASFARKTDAVRWASDLEADIRNGRYFPVRKSIQLTVSQAIDLYLTESLSKKKSQATPLGILKWWRERIGDRLLAEVNRPLIREHWNSVKESVSARTGRPLTSRSINAYIEVLSAFLSFCVTEKEWIDENPVRKIKREPVDNARQVFLDDEELKRLLEAVEHSSNRYLKVAVLVSLSTGGRRGEVMGLTWEDIDLFSGTVRFRDTKNGDSRTVVLGRSALLAVRDLWASRSSSSLLFPTTKPRLRRSGAASSYPWEDLRRPFARACREAQVAHIRWHDLRHCAASYLLASGASLAEIGKILGHRSPVMSWRYSQLDQQRTAELARKVDQAFLSNKAA
jgi:integrase